LDSWILWRGILVRGLLVALTMILATQSASAGDSQYIYFIRYDHWSADDERSYSDFIKGIGESHCATVDECFHDPANPYRSSDKPNVAYWSDCAELPYMLRFYFAWKRSLPFSYASSVRPAGTGGDTRFTPQGNVVVARDDLPSGKTNAYDLIDRVADGVSSATYRVHPDADGSLLPDQYSPAIDPKAIHPGTMIYDPAGHLATVYRVEPNGRVWFFDAHPDNSITRLFYDLRFARAYPGVGAGFKNWRPQRLVGATRRPDGVLVGGHIELARNKDIADFSDEQFYGNGKRPDDAGWTAGTFALKGEMLDYYDYVRAKLAGGELLFDPVKEMREGVQSNCSDLHYRAAAVDLAVAAGMPARSEPERLPTNIYGTSGDWETYSTPSRDARLKTAFKSLRDEAQRFVEMYERGGDPHLIYLGSDMVADMIAAYQDAAAQCALSYRRSDTQAVALSYEDARKRLFAMSFDPYQCIERRWGASDLTELAGCRDSDAKHAWYVAEQNLRNQIDRTYDARMDFSLGDLQTPGAGKGVATAPDTDALGYLMSVRGAAPGHTVMPAMTATN
jgi:hypothetical protein